jgi:hypothetical protein
MKYNINGFSQEKLIEYGLDAQDALLLRWLVDFTSSPSISTVQSEGFTYYWIKYEAVLADLPILTIKNTKGIGKKFLSYEEKGVLVKYTHKTVQGSFSCIRFTDVINEMLGTGSHKESHCPKKSSAKRPSRQDKSPLPQKEQCALPPEGLCALPQKEQTKDPSTKDPSTKDISIGADTKLTIKQLMAFKPEVVDAELWESFLKARKERKAIQTKRAISIVLSELKLCNEGGVSMEDALGVFLGNPWQGLEAEWVFNKLKKSPGSATNRNQGSIGTKPTTRTIPHENFADKDYGQSTITAPWLTGTGIN